MQDITTLEQPQTCPGCGLQGTATQAVHLKWCPALDNMPEPPTLLFEDAWSPARGLVYGGLGSLALWGLAAGALWLAQVVWTGGR